ncbi:MAG: hypothetical protein WAX77_09785 [Methylococcaceae bacterium]
MCFALIIASCSNTYFVSGADKIRLSSTWFIGTLPSADLQMGITATTANSFVLYDKTIGNLYYDDDANGTDSVAVKIAVLGTSTHLTLINTDLVVV